MMCQWGAIMMPMETKRCATCGEDKPRSEYYAVSKTESTLRPHCKPCHSTRRKANYAKAGGKDIPYEQLIKREYGITLADYNALLRSQAHRCAVCRRPETIRSKRTGELRRLAVDHDHVTGAVRGLLCHRCNILVWAFEENHAILGLINHYVENFRASFQA